MENLTEIQKQIDKRVENKIAKEIEPIIKAIEKTFLNDLKIQDEHLLNSNIGYNTINSFLLTKLDDLELKSNYKHLFKRRKNQLEEIEVRELLNPKKETPQKDVLANKEEVEETKLSKILKEVTIEKDDKLKQIQFLNDFLTTCYKGNDSKQKVERELIVLNKEYSMLNDFIRKLTSDTLPF